jgi:hypothetical protein
MRAAGKVEFGVITFELGTGMRSVMLHGPEWATTRYFEWLTMYVLPKPDPGVFRTHAGTVAQVGHDVGRNCLGGQKKYKIEEWNDVML